MDEPHRTLTGWKAIAAFIGRDARTAKRWEGARGMPVHRVPGGERGMVWADADEIRRWMTRAIGVDGANATSLPAGSSMVMPAGPGSAGVDAPLPVAAMGKRWGIVAAVLATILIVLLTVLPAHVAPTAAKPDPYADDTRAESLYLRGVFLWNTRTPGGLAEARDDFRELIRMYPDRAEAYAQLANCYLLLREFGSMPERQAYQEAERAAGRALAIDPNSAGAIRALAFADFWGHGRVEGLDLFKRALRADPSSAQTRHWYATALGARGRFGEAVQMIESARRLEPQSAAIVADEALIEIQSGNLPAARATLRDLGNLDPRSSAVHRYRAVLALLDRDGETWLREKHAEVVLRGDAKFGRTLPRLSAAFGTGGFHGLARALAAEAADEAARGGCAITAADYAALAGDAASARSWVLHAAADRDPVLVQLPGDVLLRALRDDPTIRPLFGRPTAVT